MDKVVCPNCGYDGNGFGKIRVTVLDNQVFYGCPHCGKSWEERERKETMGDKRITISVGDNVLEYIKKRAKPLRMSTVQFIHFLIQSDMEEMLCSLVDQQKNIDEYRELINKGMEENPFIESK